eukprot:1117200-Pyramimonas_sp.AAC.1
MADLALSGLRHWVNQLAADVLQHVPPSSTIEQLNMWGLWGPFWHTMLSDGIRALVGDRLTHPAP